VTIGIHIIGDPGKFFDYLRQLKPPAIKLMEWESPESIRELKTISPLVLYRKYTDLTYHDSADAFVASIPNKLFGLGLIHEGINEPIISSPADAQALNTWTLRFAQLMHARGEQVAGYSFSTGNPDLMLTPYLWTSMAQVDAISLHEYNSQAAGWSMGKVHSQWIQLVPKQYMKPILITEWGFDNGGDPAKDGWRANVSEAQYIDILKQGLPLLADTKGACLFTFGGGWPSFDSWPVHTQLLGLG
jgi:hypothetical protein